MLRFAPLVLTVAAVPLTIFLLLNPPAFSEGPPTVHFQSWPLGDTRPSIWIMGSVPAAKWQRVHDDLAPSYGSLYEVK